MKKLPIVKCGGLTGLGESSGIKTFGLAYNAFCSLDNVLVLLPEKQNKTKKPCFLISFIKISFSPPPKSFVIKFC
jgi:hypothetical protein